MLKEHSSFVKQLIAFVDCILIAAAFLAAHSVVSEVVKLAPPAGYWVMVVGFVAFYLYFAWTRSLFSVLQFDWAAVVMRHMVAIFLSAGILGAAILYLVPDSHNSRRLYLSFSVFSFLFIALEKLFLKWLFGTLRRHGKNTTPILVLGRGRRATRIVKELERNPQWGLRVVRILDVSVSPARLEEILRSTYVEEVYLVVPRTLTRTGLGIDPFLQVCEEMGRPARVFMNIADATRFARWEYHQFMERPTLVSHTAELDPDQILFKRAFDCAGALVGVMVLLWLYPFLAVLIKLTSPGPVLFRQIRVGRNGRRFKIYKFRTMYQDAEERKKELLEKNELRGAVFKIKDDPRVTPLGRVLRKLSLDEFPQFFNVLRGEMSLVGTRPPTPDEVDNYEKWHHRRISTKPGLTGLWQVSGRNKITDFDEIVKLDLQYIDSWSLWLDVKILVKTFFVVLSRNEAY